MTKQDMKRNLDRHIRNTKGVTRTTGRKKGYREAAWSEVKALELLLNAAKGE